MLEINGKSIYITRGDSALIRISATVSGTSPPTQYSFNPGDKVKFTVKKNAKDKDELISKEVTVETESTFVDFSIEPEDTKPLEFGKYRYDVQLTKDNGWVDTIITSSTFKVGEEIG